MAQTTFGRRGAPTRSRPASPDRTAASAAAGDDPLATETGSSTGRTVAILAGIAGVVTVAAGGLAYGLNAVTGDTGTRNPCRPGQPGCTNQYQVSMSCGSQQEQRSISVNAASPDAAEAKAERYNRGCRARGSRFLASVIHNAAKSYYSGSRAGERRVAEDDAPKRRRAWRFRRR
jgi:hypothetical protein